LTASGGAARLRGGAPPEMRARARRGSWALGRAQAGSRWHNGLGRGHDTDAEAPEGTGLRQSGPAAVLACSGERLHEQQGYGNGKSEAWGGELPQETALERLSDGEDTVGPWVNGSGNMATRRGVC
jgi:hypothetical protein